MRAVGFYNFGEPSVLQMLDLPEVHASFGQVRVRVHASTINPTDTYLRKGARADSMRDISAPHVPGMDIAGVVDEIGANTKTDLVIGDHVMAMVVPNSSHGGYRESIALSVNSVVKIPRNTTLIEAATLPMNALTARQSLDQLGLKPGQTLAVTGAAGCYGGYVVQLAKAQGLRVFADAASHDEELVRSLGADVVVPRGDDIASNIRNVLPNGVDGLADGSFQNEKALGAVRDGGGFASVRGWSSQEREISFYKISVRNYDDRADLLDQLRLQVENGFITLRVAQTYTPDQAADAHRRLEAKGTRGRLVISWSS